MALLPRYNVVRYGTDTSGRPIYMTRFMHQCIEAIKADPRVKPFAHKITVVQGAWMERAGGGATASAGYHDKAGCVDFRTWNLTTAELNTFIVVARLHGMALWRRDKSYEHGGMDPHAHGTIGNDKVMTSGAAASWSGYLRGTNGLASGRKDYEWRPSPIRYFQWKKAVKRPKINLTVLQTGWGRKHGKTYGTGKAIHRKFAKVLRKKGFLPKYAYKQGIYGNAMREAVKRANKHYGITAYTGSKNDRPTWALCRKLGLAPYRVEKKPKKVKAFAKSTTGVSK